MFALTLEARSTITKDQILSTLPGVAGVSAQGFTLQPIDGLRPQAPVYTAQGLQGYAGDYRISSQALSNEISYYLFARGKTIVILGFLGPDVTSDQELVNAVLNSLRIDK